MFIKKDLRKIPTILADAAEEKGIDETNKLTDLRLEKRKAEFRGSVKILCQPSNLTALSQLQSLSLYDCEIGSLEGIGMLTTLQTLNVGRNPLTQVPADLENLQSLQGLWLDDCALEGAFPAPILKLTALQELRISNNKLTDLPSDISLLTNLQTLCLDNNKLTTLPTNLQHLPHLTSLFVRSNLLKELPEIVMETLEVLHVSSNQLTTLPASLVECQALSHIYANSNKLTTIVDGLHLLPNLIRLQLSHNEITYIELSFWDFFGTPDESGVCSNNSTNDSNKCTVLVGGNPVLQQFLKTGANKDKDTDNNNDDDDNAMDVEPASIAA